MTGRTVSRLIVGFGHATPLETGITLDRVHGLPYIPGTALKGICRSWKLDDIASRPEVSVPRLPKTKAKAGEQKGRPKHTPLDLLEVFLTAADHKAREASWQGLKKALEALFKEKHPIVSGRTGLDSLLELADARWFKPVFGSQSQRGPGGLPGRVPGPRGKRKGLV